MILKAWLYCVEKYNSSDNKQAFGDRGAKKLPLNRKKLPEPDWCGQSSASTCWAVWEEWERENCNRDDAILTKSCLYFSSDWLCIGKQSPNMSTVIWKGWVGFLFDFTELLLYKEIQQLHQKPQNDFSLVLNFSIIMFWILVIGEFDCHHSKGMF